jgi:hypothetical protein
MERRSSMQTTRGEATVREVIVIWVEKAMRAPEQPAVPCRMVFG